MIFDLDWLIKDIFACIMNIKELLKDLEPITIIEFKNYLVENLSNLCSKKNSNSKVILNFKNKELYCKKCGCKLHRNGKTKTCLLYTSPSPRDGLLSRMPSSA